MHLTIPLKTLKSMVGALKDNSPKSPHQEILSNFLLVAKGETLAMTVTDLRLWIIRREDCPDIKTEGAIAINAKRFTDTVNSLTGQDVEIKVSESTAQIKCGRSKFNLPVISGESYPELPKVIDAQTFNIKTELFKSGISAALQTVSNDPTKPMLLGVNIKEVSEDDSYFLDFVSSDGRKGSLYKFPVPFSCGLNNTIPTRTAKEIEHIDQEEIEVSFTDNYLWINSRGLTLISPFVEGSYPPIRSMLPKLQAQEKTGVVICDRKELIASVKRVGALCEGDIYDYLTDIAIEQDEMVFVSEIGGVGRVEERLPCEIKVEGFKSTFNIKFLQQTLGAINAKSVRLEAYHGSNPCLFIYPEENPDHETFLMSVARR